MTGFTRYTTSPEPPMVEGRPSTDISRPAAPSAASLARRNSATKYSEALRSVLNFTAWRLPEPGANRVTEPPPVSSSFVHPQSWRVMAKGRMRREPACSAMMSHTPTGRLAASSAFAPAR